MAGLLKRKSAQARAAEHQRKQEEKAAKIRKEVEERAEGDYRPAPEPDVLGWGHRKESSPWHD
ncbi:hypothetical protein [Streptomyces sp. C36]|uniref:hypothetical protein n=1 Tax=Streptomyces sp. C36 TaxID=3237122 RepID=UPI0034C5E953